MKIYDLELMLLLLNLVALELASLLAILFLEMISALREVNSLSYHLYRICHEHNVKSLDKIRFVQRLTFNHFELFSEFPFDAKKYHVRINLGF